MKFYKTPAIIKFLFNKCDWRIPTHEKVIYPTFDDGPQPGLTEFILETLKTFQAKGTFFCVGENIKRYPKLATKIIEEGHVIGNHTFNHLSGWKTNDRTYFENIDLFEETVRQCEPPLSPAPLFRPPYGQVSGRQSKELKKRGYRIVMWDVLSYDFVKNLNKQYALTRIKRASQPGTIVLFHDNYKAEHNIRYLLPNYLNYFAELNYRFSALEM